MLAVRGGLALTLTCAVLVAASRSHGTAGAPSTSRTILDAGAPVTDVADAGMPSCPLPFPGADTVVARVGAVQIRACEVHLARLRAIRLGQRPASPRETLDLLVEEAVLAQEAERRGLASDPAVRMRTVETLAAAALRERARSLSAANLPGEAVGRAWQQRHAADLARPERLHVRTFAFATERQARAVLRAAARGSFDAAVAAADAAGNRADRHDLGLLDRDAAGVPAAVVQAAFEATTFGAIHPHPVRVVTTERTGRRRRPRRVTRWLLVQSLERLAPETPAWDGMRDRVLARLSASVYDDALAVAFATATTPARDTDAGPTVDPVALRAIRVGVDGGAAVAASGTP